MGRVEASGARASALRRSGDKFLVHRKFICHAREIYFRRREKIFLLHRKFSSDASQLQRLAIRLKRD